MLKASDRNRKSDTRLEPRGGKRLSNAHSINLTITSTNLLLGLRDPKNSAIWQAYVGRYRPLLIAYGQKLGLREADAEDVAQLTLVNFCRAYQDGKYDRERGRLRTWLFAIARNQILNWYRTRDSHLQLGDRSDVGQFPAELNDENRMEQIWEEQWRDALLRQGLEEIKREVEPRTFEAFQLFASDQHSAEEVGKRFGMTANAVFSAKRRILRRLRELLPQLEEAF